MTFDSYPHALHLFGLLSTSYFLEYLHSSMRFCVVADVEPKQLVSDFVSSRF